MSKFNVLSLDDDPNFNLLLQRRLTHGMYNIFTTEKTKDFLAQLEKNVWDICLVDLNLAEGQEAGFKVVRYIREKLKKSIPIMVLSRNDDYSKITHALECGATDYITKPFDLEMFITKVSYLLEDEAAPSGPLKTLPIPKLYQNCIVVADFTPLSITEEGISLSGPSYVSKGIYVEIKNSFLNSILEKESVRLMVSRNSKVSESVYNIFLEFGSEDIEVMENAKKWLVQKKRSSNEIASRR